MLDQVPSVVVALHRLFIPFVLCMLQNRIIKSEKGRVILRKLYKFI